MWQKESLEEGMIWLPKGKGMYISLTLSLIMFSGGFH